jgi:hypothetical protein
MAEIFWALVAIGGPIVIAACIVYGLLTHGTAPPRGIIAPPDGQDQSVAPVSRSISRLFRGWRTHDHL